MADKKTTPKVMDVAHPKDTKPTNTSKPVIVGHESTIDRDPMVAPEPTTAPSDTQPETTETETPIISKPKRELKLQPLSDSSSSLGPSNEKSSEETDNAGQDSDTSLAEVVEDSIPDDEANYSGKLQEKPEDNDTQDADSLDEKLDSDDDDVKKEDTDQSGAVINEIVDNVSTKKERTEEAQKLQMIENEINELASSKKYFVKTSTPPSKKKATLLILLLILLIVGGLGWYLGYGPGKSLWLKDQTAEISQPSSTTTTTSTDETAKKTPNKIAFTNQSINSTFEYPVDWQVEVIKDTEFPTRDVITLTSPKHEVTTLIDGLTLKADVNMRFKIYVENTKNPTEYKSDIEKMKSCSSEDIIINNSNLKTVFTDSTLSEPSISRVTLSTNGCIGNDGGLFGSDNQIQFASKNNTYIFYAEYIYDKDYLIAKGTKDEEAIKLAQSSGISTSKDNFKATTSYAQLLEILKSFKEL